MGKGLIDDCAWRSGSRTKSWSSGSPGRSGTIPPSLKPIYQQYKDQNYLVAVFLSGEEDLYQQTRDLLLYNRRRLAEKEVQAEKQAGLAMGS